MAFVLRILRHFQMFPVTEMLFQRVCGIRAKSAWAAASWARASRAGSKLDQGGVIQQPIVARAALVVPPLILNKLHYPGCQNGRNIIHPGLSSQAHSNTPAFSLYLLILPNKKIELAYFQLLLLFYFSTTFSPTQIKPKLCGREGHPVSKASWIIYTVITERCFTSSNGCMY